MKNPVLFLLILPLIFFSCTSNPSNDKTEVNTSEGEAESVSLVLAPSEFKKAMTKTGAQLVDVRTMEEVAEGFIDGAQNIDFYGDNFESEILKLDKEKPILVYCRSGGRSGNTAKMLKAAGFREIYDLKGGYSNWPSE